MGSDMAICSSCGGSGIKRISEQRFRTCQHCLGRGELQPVYSSPKPALKDRSVVHALTERAEKSKEVVFKTAAASTSVR
ncbi:putative DnaJ type IV chaperone protein [Synechococcus sp. BIOS-U3-1]|nr:putative DnaJ type IV chaperone protein [Synechococcus sp. BIOS-U3-1]